MSVNSSNIIWQGHDSVRLAGRRVVYFDPWEVQGPPADLILITHDHFDHLDVPTVKALSEARTQIVTEASSAARLRESGVENNITVMEPGDEIEVLGVGVRAVPAYNLDKDFHPRARNNLGFIVNLDGLSVYHAGDSDFIPEMKDIRVQVALLPVSGTYVMTWEEAVQAALAIGPELAIPMHYGKIVGDPAMAEKFAARLKGRVEVEIKPAAKSA
ncbi:MAG: MBL fold metallo-hydrolase [Candidatus Adiutrix sp.]|jgi:L-ascorbate metabolism protein UlaG (beta-lactamase superfamily)|nr:MBL fold metallo-hydrolase [Candidatus Adiutrix sp.]